MSEHPAAEVGTPTVDDHAFESDPWWARCVLCGMGAAAHTSTSVELVEPRKREDD